MRTDDDEPDWLKQAHVAAFGATWLKLRRVWTYDAAIHNAALRRAPAHGSAVSNERRTGHLFACGCDR